MLHGALEALPQQSVFHVRYDQFQPVLVRVVLHGTLRRIVGTSGKGLLVPWRFCVSSRSLVFVLIPESASTLRSYTVLRNMGLCIHWCVILRCLICPGCIHVKIRIWFFRGLIRFLSELAFDPLHEV